MKMMQNSQIEREPSTSLQKSGVTQLRLLVPAVYAAGWLTGGQLQTGLASIKAAEGGSATGMVHFVVLFAVSGWLIFRAMKFVAIAIKSGGPADD